MYDVITARENLSVEHESTKHLPITSDVIFSISFAFSYQVQLAFIFLFLDMFNFELIMSYVFY